MGKSLAELVKEEFTKHPNPGPAKSVSLWFDQLAKTLAENAKPKNLPVMGLPDPNRTARNVRILEEISRFLFLRFLADNMKVIHLHRHDKPAGWSYATVLDSIRDLQWKAESLHRVLLDAIKVDGNDEILAVAVRDEIIKAANAIASMKRLQDEEDFVDQSYGPNSSKMIALLESSITFTILSLQLDYVTRVKPFDFKQALQKLSQILTRYEGKLAERVDAAGKLAGLDERHAVIKSYTTLWVKIASEYH